MRVNFGFGSGHIMTFEPDDIGEIDFICECIKTLEAKRPLTITAETEEGTAVWAAQSRGQKNQGFTVLPGGKKRPPF